MIKNIKRASGIIGNCITFPIVFPISIPNYVKKEIPFLNSIIFFINLVTWICILFFVLGLVIDKLRWSDTDTGWAALISKNPYELINNSFFGWNLIIISSFYLLATVKGWWATKEIKKDLVEWFVE